MVLAIGFMGETQVSAATLQEYTQANQICEICYQGYNGGTQGPIIVTRGFLKKGNSQFGEELAKGVKRALEFVIRMESMGSYNSFVLSRNIPLPEGMFTGGWALRCTDVNSSFRVWMRLYRKDITSACERSGNVRWRGMYRQLCVEFKDTFYHQLMDELVTVLFHPLAQRDDHAAVIDGVAQGVDAGNTGHNDDIPAF